ncbi:Rv0361 family membrane protein [Micromonospora sonchi]|nr:hypothetical protein [Micromonospora sonchi]
MTQPPAGGPTGPAGLPAPSGAAPGPGDRRGGARTASLALAVVLLLCAGGGVAAFLTLRNAESGEGAPEPSVAVDDFLTAVYQERDAAKAARLVCGAARDQDQIRGKVAEIETYVSTHQNPRFRWNTPTVDNETGDRATVTTTVTVTTADEKITDQDLRFTVIRRSGWWVCEVS